MKDRALVLGGGGPLGIAWETGVAAGLAEEGIEIGAADFVLGTSAGSVVGAQLAGGASAKEMAEAQIAFSRQMAASGAAAPVPPDLTPLIGFMMRFPATGQVSLDLRKELGQYALKGGVIGEDAFLAQMGGTGIPSAWPAKFACTAVDTESGEFHVWRQGDGVELVRGVASSCAVPGIYPPVTLKGRRWMDGGMRSSFSVDQAAGYSRVLAFAVIPMAMAAQRVRARYDYEAQSVTEAGGRVELIAPDEAVMEAFGPNLMDGTRRLPVVEAGIAQGKQEAARIKAFWN
jgi:NTE family protein